MHLIKDENGNICAHAHEHEHPHTHADGHTHEHCHEHGHDGTHTHTHDQECDSCGGCGQESQTDKNEALLSYMYQHNQSHAAELDQMAAKLQREGLEGVSEQIRKAVDEFQKGNMYLGIALAQLKENH